MIAGVLAAGSFLRNTGTPREGREPGIIERGLLTSIAMTGAVQAFSLASIDMNVMTTGMYALLVVGVGVLAVFRQKIYLYAGLAAVLVFAGLLIFSDDVTFQILLIAGLSFAAVVLIACRAMWTSPTEAVNWSVYAAVSATAAFTTAYFQRMHVPAEFGAYHGWEIAAAVLSAAGAYATRCWLCRDNRQAAAIWAVMSAFFAALCPILFFDSQSSTGLALLAMAASLAIVYARSGYIMLRRFVPVFFSIAAYFLASEAVKFARIALREIEGHASIVPKMQRIFESDGQHLFIVGFAVSALCGLISWALGLVGNRSEAPDEGAKKYAYITGILCFGSAYTLLQLSVYGLFSLEWQNASEAYFVLRAVLTLLFYAAGVVLCLLWSRRPSFATAAALLLTAGLLRTGYFDLVIDNPLWDGKVNVGEAPFVNMLAVLYLLPAFACAFFAWRAAHSGERRRVGFFAGTAAILAFIFISYSVRQWYHGGNLAAGSASLAEIFSYSVVWLLFGLAVVTGGAMSQIRAVRLAGAVIVTVVIGKVFLYDASVLEGLYRVIAFVGLGISLLALGGFYGWVERRTQRALADEERV